MATSDAARFDPFDVVPFPYADRLAEKRRPALVISNRKLAMHGVIWVAMITSADNERWPSDVEITDLVRAGLPAPSVVRPAKIACIDPNRIAIAAPGGSTERRRATQPKAARVFGVRDLFFPFSQGERARRNLRSSSIGRRLQSSKNGWRDAGGMKRPIRPPSSSSEVFVVDRGIPVIRDIGFRHLGERGNVINAARIDMQ